jgi:hypothetical protein
MTDKVQHFVEGQLKTFHHANTFAREQTTGPERVRIGPRGGQRYLFGTLASVLGPPYKLLYVLHTSRTKAPLGRYESPWLEDEELTAFLDRFGQFITEDARHDLWVLGGGGSGTIVWDRHDLMYAYGPIAPYVTLLEAAGFREGWPSWPVPHAHRYNAEWDQAERDILGAFEWDRTPLRTEDEQYRDSG